jgi:hypothetical protein
MTNTIQQIAFSLGFAIITVAVAQYILWVFAGAPTSSWIGASHVE